MRSTSGWLLNGLAAVVSLAGGAALGYIDLQTSELTVTLGAVFVFNMVLGAVAPRGGWFWPGLSTFGILLVNWFPQSVNLESNRYLPRTFGSYLLLAAILLVVGTAGMLFGVIVRRSVHVNAQ